MRYPKANETTTSSRMLIFAVRSILDLSVNMYCRVTSSRLNAMVKFPRVYCGNTSARLYGMDVIGDVPSEAFVMKPTAIDMQNNPIAKTAYRLPKPDSMGRTTTCCISIHRTYSGGWISFSSRTRRRRSRRSRPGGGPPRARPCTGCLPTRTPGRCSSGRCRSSSCGG